MMAADYSARPFASGGLPVAEEVSAGGLVVDVRDGTAFVAIIARRNRAGRLEWCLPKGHLELQETPMQAAVREIEEETGILGQVLKHLGTIDYWFIGDEARVHKVVHHYLLSAVSGELTTENDPDGEAEKVAWIRLEDLREHLAYPNERRLALRAQAVLNGER